MQKARIDTSMKGMLTTNVVALCEGGAFGKMSFHFHTAAELISFVENYHFSATFTKCLLAANPSTYFIVTQLSGQFSKTHYLIVVVMKCCDQNASLKS